MAKPLSGYAVPNPPSSGKTHWTVEVDEYGNRTMLCGVESGKWTPTKQFVDCKFCQVALAEQASNRVYAQAMDRLYEQTKENNE
jgi:hypothetical protein